MGDYDDDGDDVTDDNDTDISLFQPLSAITSPQELLLESGSRSGSRSVIFTGK